MKIKKVVHKFMNYYFGEGGQTLIYCTGAWSKTATSIKDWRKVTCKKCLKKRKNK